LSFSEFGFTPEIHRSIRDRGHTQPTPIQQAAIPPALEGRDLVGTAETGSGKTAAYLLPMLDRLIRSAGEPAGRKPIRALVLAPTRELAAQVGREFGLFARNTRLKVAVIVGGDSMHRQISELQGGAQVLVACPGRLIDHMERGTIKLDKVEVVIIDEADRLLDMGFLPQLRRVMRTVPKNRQTLMFSATFGSGVAQVAREFFTDPVHVSVGDKSAPPSTIRQTVYPVTINDKGPMLLEILKRKDVESAIVFTRTKSRADRVVKMISRGGIKAIVIHGDRSQGQRNAALAGFRSGSYRVLVATDLAARGLDITDVSHVINYDLPDEVENYIHRIGRTARMGKSGEAFSLVTPEERTMLGKIERTLGRELERGQVDGFEQLEITAPPPVKLFRSTGVRRPSIRNRTRARWA